MQTAPWRWGRRDRGVLPRFIAGAATRQENYRQHQAQSREQFHIGKALTRFRYTGQGYVLAHGEFDVRVRILVAGMVTERFAMFTYGLLKIAYVRLF